MATVQTVAENIARKSSATGKRLQKLVYYAEAWSLAWEDQSLFGEAIEGWKDGPCCRSLRNRRNAGDLSSLTIEQESVIGDVLRMYGDMTEQELIYQTHQELPWLESRKGLNPAQPGNREIRRETMKRFYREQEQAFVDLFQEFNLNMRIRRGRIEMFGNIQEIEHCLDQTSRLIHDKALPLSKRRLLIQSAGCCEYVSA